MGLWKIHIDRLQEPDSNGYRRSETIYEQQFDKVNVEAIIAVANNLTWMATPEPPYYDRKDFEGLSNNSLIDK